MKKSDRWKSFAWLDVARFYIGGFTIAIVASGLGAVSIARANGPSTKQPIDSSSPSSTSTATATGIRYRWEPDRDYHYRFSLTAHLEDAKYVTSGECTYRLDPKAPASSSQKLRSAKGTAFVVNAQGLLVTAAHVVEDATSIRVKLNGKTYPAQIAGIRSSDDLAILKIDATELAALPLADSEQVQLGQSIWALGFPLTDLLGENLKINTGMISGINQSAAQKVFQVDTTLNPGNSGGPVLNDAGQVIGVAIKRIKGRDISDVGLTRPINAIRELFQEARLPLNAPSLVAGKKDGPAIARTATPSVALVEAEIDPNRRASRLSFRVTSSSGRRESGSHRLPILSFPQSDAQQVQGTLTVDDSGHLLESSNEEPLPFVLGMVCSLGIEPIATNGDKGWERADSFSVSLIQQSANQDPLHRLVPSFVPLGRVRANSTSKISTYQAEERSEYQWIETTDQQIKAEKKHSLKTSDDPKRPFLELTGKGSFTFDKEAGYLVAASSQYEFYHRLNANLSLYVPLEWNVAYVPSEVVEIERKESEERRVAAEQERRRKNSLQLEQLPEPNAYRRVQRFDSFDAVIVQAIQVSDDGQTVLAAANDGSVYFFSSQRSEPVRQLSGLQSNVRFLEISPDGKKAIGGAISNLRGWNLADGESFSLPEHAGSQPHCAAFSPDSRYVYLAFPLHGIEKWDIEKSKAVLHWPSHDSPTSMVVSTDGKQLMVVDRDGIHSWDTVSGKALKSVPLPRPSRGHYAYSQLSPSGVGLFNRFEAIDILGLKDCQKQGEVSVRSPSQNGMAISSDGKLAAIADSSGKAVVIWDVKKNKLIDQFQVDTISSQTVSLSRDGKYLLTCGYDKILQLWERQGDHRTEKKK